MTITQLKYVLAVAENKNFTKAAQKTFVTQPTLSMQIQKLEEDDHTKSAGILYHDTWSRIVTSDRKIAHAIWRNF